MSDPTPTPQQVAEARQLFRQRFAHLVMRPSTTGEDDDQSYEDREYEEALNTVLYSAYAELAARYRDLHGNLAGWPSWSQAMAAIGFDATEDMLYEWVQDQLTRAGLLAPDALDEDQMALRPIAAADLRTQLRRVEATRQRATAAGLKLPPDLREWIEGTRLQLGQDGLSAEQIDAIPGLRPFTATELPS